MTVKLNPKENGQAADINVAHIAADKAIPENWEIEFKKTKFAMGGGLSFECSDYEGMYDDLLDFIRNLIKQQRSEVAREINTQLLKAVESGATNTLSMAIKIVKDIEENEE